MWFTLGALIVVVASAALAWWRGRTRWLDERPGVSWKASTNKGKLVGLEVGVRTATRLEFDIKPETVVDRWAKAVGLSVEGEVGNRRFDEALYLIADDPQVVGALRHDRALADALLALAEVAGGAISKVDRVRCRAGWLRVKLKTDAAAEMAGTIAQGLADKVAAVGAALDAVGKTARPDPLWWRSTVLVAIAGGLAVNAGVQFLHATLGGLPQTLDDGAIWLAAMPVGGLLLAALVGATIVLLGRTSRAHLVMLEVLFVGGLGALGTAAAELRDMNIELDSSTPKTYETTVARHTIHTSRKGGTSYSVTLAPWPGSDGEVDFKIGSGEYHALTPGTPVEVSVRDGYLGWAWLESYARR